MVCKQEVLTWFKDLECYKRIDLMYELFNMCMPFEIRFMGTCIEEIGKQSYQELRGLTIIANDVEKLSKDNLLTNSLLDENTRSRVLLFISLLSTRNCLSANWFYKTLFRTDVLEDYIVKGNCIDENLQSEFLLLLTMSLHHPAFTFEQKSYFGYLLVHLIKLREGKKSVAAKPNVYCYPPGFGYPPPHIIPSHSEISVIPIKTASPLGTGGDPSQHPPPPGLPIHPAVNPPLDYIAPAVWQRPPFTATMCAPPEGLAFPTRSISPLVSQPTSSPSSRCSSPHRNYTIRSVTGLPPPPLPPRNVEVQSNPSLVSMESISSPSIPKFMSILKPSEEELAHLQEEKYRDPQWMNQRQNGMMFFGLEQMNALKLEGENSLHCSTSSSNSSLNQSPPQTPTAALILPHGPGRGGSGPAGDAKSRMNGIPPPFMTGVHPPTGAPPPMCESTPPPPFSNCTVPYTSNYPSHHVTLTAIPNSSIQHPRNPPTCCNCGALGHTGADCTAQTIEDITQKAYSLEYAPVADADK